MTEGRLKIKEEDPTKLFFALLCLMLLVVETAQAIEGELTIENILQDSHGNLQIHVFWNGDVNQYYNETQNDEWFVVGYLETLWILRIEETSQVISNCRLRTNQNEKLVFDEMHLEDLPENCTYELEMYYFTYDNIPPLFHERSVLNYYHTYTGSFINQTATSAAFSLLCVLPFAIVAIVCLLLWHYK